MLSRKKKPGSRTAVLACCRRSSNGEDWSFADPLHPPRGATLDLVPGLAAGDHTRSDPCLVFLSASPSGRCSSVSLQTATGCCKNLTPTVVLSQCSHQRGRVLPSGSCKKLLQDERCCAHSHGILAKLAEIDPRSGERLFRSITLDESAQLWQNGLADLQTGPSTQEDELWVEKINEIGDTCS